MARPASKRQDYLPTRILQVEMSSSTPELMQECFLSKISRVPSAASGKYNKPKYQIAINTMV
jgi:hypothetical protein